MTVGHWVIGLALLSSAACGGWAWQIWHLQRAVTAAATSEVADDAPAPLLFSKAEALGAQGQWQVALRYYSLIDLQRAPELTQAVRYNRATLYLQAAQRLWRERGLHAYAELAALLDQAEQDYRDVLRVQPEHWEARYNLEFALRLHPPEKEQKKADWRGTKSSVFATLPGLPGGGP